jgi:hypothetical protein
MAQVRIVGVLLIAQVIKAQVIKAQVIKAQVIMAQVRMVARWTISLICHILQRSTLTEQSIITGTLIQPILKGDQCTPIISPTHSRCTPIMSSLTKGDGCTPSISPSPNNGTLATAGDMVIQTRALKGLRNMIKMRTNAAALHVSTYWVAYFCWLG